MRSRLGRATVHAPEAQIRSCSSLPPLVGLSTFDPSLRPEAFAEARGRRLGRERAPLRSHPCLQRRRLPETSVVSLTTTPGTFVIASRARLTVEANAESACAGLTPAYGLGGGAHRESHDDQSDPGNLHRITPFPVIVHHLPVRVGIESSGADPARPGRDSCVPSENHRVEASELRPDLDTVVWLGSPAAVHY